MKMMLADIDENDLKRTQSWVKDHGGEAEICVADVSLEEECDKLVKAAMSDGSTKTVSDGFTCSPTALGTAGAQKITVSYGGQTASFNVTVKAAAAAVQFNDVSSSDWYYGYVTDLAGKGILNGSVNPDGSSSFRPNGSITRSEFAAILARASGESVSAYSRSSSFYDVASDNWASPYIEWANANGIASGSGGAFRPQARITRQEMAAMYEISSDNRHTQ